MAASSSSGLAQGASPSSSHWGQLHCAVYPQDEEHCQPGPGTYQPAACT